jgi:hypothetical protein
MCNYHKQVFFSFFCGSERLYNEEHSDLLHLIDSIYYCDEYDNF